MRLAIILIVTSAVYSWEQGASSQHSYRDSVLNAYFALVDTSGKFDTADINFKALKAYYYNDTAHLKELNTYITEQRAERQNWDLWQSDIPLPKLSQLNVEVAFRFVFSIYGSPAYEAITITQNDTIHKLDYSYYYHDKDSSKFDIRKEFQKRLSEKDWQEVASKLLYADFWGLKSEKDYRGADGNDLTVMGYQKFDNMERNHYVHRWTNTTLNDGFYYVYYKLLNNNERIFGTK